jgi:hypothetical protein
MALRVTDKAAEVIGPRRGKLLDSRDGLEFFTYSVAIARQRAVRRFGRESDRDFGSRIFPVRTSQALKHAAEQQVVEIARLWLRFRPIRFNRLARCLVRFGRRGRGAGALSAIAAAAGRASAPCARHGYADFDHSIDEDLEIVRLRAVIGERCPEAIFTIESRIGRAGQRSRVSATTCRNTTAPTPTPLVRSFFTPLHRRTTAVP